MTEAERMRAILDALHGASVIEAQGMLVAAMQAVCTQGNLARVDRDFDANRERALFGASAMQAPPGRTQ